MANCSSGDGISTNYAGNGTKDDLPPDEDLERIVNEAIDEAIEKLTKGRDIVVPERSLEVLRSILWRALGTVTQAIAVWRPRD